MVTPEQAARNAAGIARCRAVVDAITARRAQPETEPARPLTPSEEIHQRALERAITARRDQRLNRLDLAS